MIAFEANYSKKVGLPGYSSHQYSVTIRVEISDLSQLESESAKVHAILQQCVDREIQKTGYLPSATHSPKIRSTNLNDNSHTVLNIHSPSDNWMCSEKQRDLLLTIVEERKLSDDYLELLAQERFSKSILAITKPETSTLITELLTEFPGTRS